MTIIGTSTVSEGPRRVAKIAETFSLVAQLVPGGRLVIPVGPSGLQHLTIVDRVDDRTVVRQADACVFVPLIGRHAWADR